MTPKALICCHLLPIGASFAPRTRALRPGAAH